MSPKSDLGLAAVAPPTCGSACPRMIASLSQGELHRILIDEAALKLVCVAKGAAVDSLVIKIDNADPGDGPADHALAERVAHDAVFWIQCPIVQGLKNGVPLLGHLHRALNL